MPIQQKNFLPSLHILRTYHGLLSRRYHHVTPFILQKNTIRSRTNSLYLCHRNYSWPSWIVTLSASQPVLFFQGQLDYVHSVSGLPWWAVIMLTTFGIRACVTLPFAIYQNQMVAKIENVHQELKIIVEQLKKEAYFAAKTHNWDEKTLRYVMKKNVKSYYTRLIIRDNCHPFKNIILVLFQIPIWICFSFSLRNMVYMMPVSDLAAELTFLELSHGGVLWFPNLTVPDYFIIPLLLGIVNLLIIEMHGLRKLGKKSWLHRISTNLLRGFSIFLIPVAAVAPSCVSFYWLCSSLFGLGQNVLLQFPRFRRACKILKTPSESSTPFKDISTNLRSKLLRYQFFK